MSVSLKQAQKGKQEVKSTKKVSLKEQAQQKLQQELVEAVEEFAKADIEVRSMTDLPVFKEQEEAKKKLLGILDQCYKPEVKGKATGIEYGAEFGMKGNVTVLGREAVEADPEHGIKGDPGLSHHEAMKYIHKELGDDMFYRLATIGVTALKDYMAPKKVEAITTTARTKARTVKGYKL